MDYLFLRRNKRSLTSRRQQNLLFKIAERQWEERFADKEAGGRKIDCNIYKCILYYLEIKQIFLDSELSLKKFSALVQTNQTYFSNVVNKYFDCNLKELLNVYRVEYAKELLCAGKYPLEEIPGRCGFTSKSAFYASFTRLVGMSPKRYLCSELYPSSDVSIIRIYNQ